MSMKHDVAGQNFQYLIQNFIQPRQVAIGVALRILNREKAKFKFDLQQYVSIFSDSKGVKAQTTKRG